MNIGEKRREPGKEKTRLVREKENMIKQIILFKKF